MPDEYRTSLVSVIIVNFNGKRFLQDCLSSLFRQTHSPFEVILVDNASHDGSVEFVRDHFPQVRILVEKVNLGFAGGSNAGIREAHGEFILTLNNDTITDPCFIENLVRPMTSDSHLGMCASKMVFPNGRINSTGICISRSGAAWDRGGGEPDDGQYEEEDEVLGPCAGAALYRRTMLDEIGFFDEDFFLFMEDVDLAFRARLAGWKCMYVPTARVVHVHGGTAGYMSEISVYYGNRNLIWYVIKNFPSMTLLFSLPWIIGRNCGVIPYYVLSGKGFTIIRAKSDALKGLPHMIRKRRSVQKKVHRSMIDKWIHTWSGFHRKR